VYTGRILPAQEALAGGLVRSVHAPEELLSAARSLAREIADNTSGVSVALSRQMLWRMLGASHPMDAHRADSRGIQMRGRSADAHEGVTSFLEKRPARFSDSVVDALPDIFPEWEDPQFS
jgi:enoyl-CoA hydratase/carnithine racemase